MMRHGVTLGTIFTFIGKSKRRFATLMGENSTGRVGGEAF